MNQLHLSELCLVQETYLAHVHNDGSYFKNKDFGFENAALTKISFTSVLGGVNLLHLRVKNLEWNKHSKYYLVGF